MYPAFYGFLMQIFARPEATDAGHTQYAANVTGKILMFYEKQFEINYLLKKLGKNVCEVMIEKCGYNVMICRERSSKPQLNCLQLFIMTSVIRLNRLCH